MFEPKNFKTGEICPQSGIWREITTLDRIPLNQGQRFPPGKNGLTRWELHEAARFKSKRIEYEDE